MNESDLKGELAKGQKAEALIRSIEPIIDDMKQKAFKQFSSSSFLELEAREECYKMMRAIELFESTLKQKVNSGKVAKSNLKKFFNL